AQQLVANVEMLFGVGQGPTTRAARYPNARIEALERLVMHDGLAPYLHRVARFRLANVWAVMRYDDHRWLPPQRLAFAGGGLTATLRCTKTSGPGRKMPELPLT
ncbi:unnamed protein product, partial [Prorocentrum cordatum]